MPRFAATCMFEVNSLLRYEERKLDALQYESEGNSISKSEHIDMDVDE